MASKPHSERASRVTAFIPYVAGLSEDVTCRYAEDTTSEQSSDRHPPYWIVDKSQGPRPAGEEVGSCVPDSLQLQPCIYRRDEESPRDPHKGAQSSHQTGETEKSAIAEHAWGQCHPILWEETSVLDQAKNNTTLLIKSLYTSASLILNWSTETRASPFRNAGNRSWVMPRWWAPPMPRQETDDGTIDAI